VAERAGHPLTPLPLDATRLPTPDWVPARSSTQAREAARRGEPLDHLVPAVVARAIARTRAYDDDPRPYRTRADELETLTTPPNRPTHPNHGTGALGGCGGCGGASSAHTDQAEDRSTPPATEPPDDD